MVIDGSTKIAALIKENPAAIDAIASINAHFNKLKNPVLRKIFASRVTIADAAKIGKCDIEAFFKKLRPLGFTISNNIETVTRTLAKEKIMFNKYDVLLDVREDIGNGQDPFRKIMQTITALPKDNVLLLINSFEPLPLICILKDRGYESEVVEIGPDEVHTYFKKLGDEKISINEQFSDPTRFGEVKEMFEGKLEVIDVRQLPMPQPMITILKALDSLEEQSALYVYHKKVPLFLLPELKERNYQIVMKTTGEGVELIIFMQEMDA